MCLTWSVQVVGVPSAPNPISSSPRNVWTILNDCVDNFDNCVDNSDSLCGQFFSCRKHETRSKMQIWQFRL